MKTALKFVLVLLSVLGSSLLSASDSPLLSTPKAEPEPDQPDVLVGLRKSGKAKGNNIYSSQLNSKQLLARVLTPRGITTYFRIQNDSQGLESAPESEFALKGDKSDSRAVVSYFNSKGRNETARVTRGSYALNITTDGETSLRQRISPKKKGSTVVRGSYGVKAQNLLTLTKDVAGVLLKRK